MLATDPTTGVTAAKEVTDVREHQADGELYEITVDTGGKITATDEHPFWVANQGRWLGAEDLKPGYTFTTADHRPATVTGTRSFSDARLVYNLTVDGIHTYYAFAGAAPVLVHNSCGEGAASVSPAFEGDFYHPDEVQKRIKAGRDARAEIPREVHETVNGVESGRVTQRVNKDGLGWYRANGNESSPWFDATIFTSVGSPTTETRVLVRSDGVVGYVLRHNYNKVIEYGYAKLPDRYVPRPR